MAGLWEVGKKAGVAGVILMSLPVLLPCAVILTFAGALLAVPVGSAAVGFYACKKLDVVHRVRSSLGYSHQEKHPGDEDELLLDAGEASRGGAEQDDKEEQQEELSISPEEFSPEEAPEKCAPGGKVSDDFIVVEKPFSDSKAPTSPEPEEQCKAAPDYFQCVEAKEYAGSEEPPHQEEGARDGEKDSPGVVAGAQVDEAGKNEAAVGLGVISEDSMKTQDSQGLNKKAENKDANASVAAEENHSRRSSVDENVSLAEDFPSSDESVVSSRNSSSKVPGTTDKEKRARLRKELALVKKVVGCKDASGGALSDQVERLYGFLGVELPPSYQQTNDYEKLLEAMNVLKAVVGVK